jgi:hypothetical protein
MSDEGHGHTSPIKTPQQLGAVLVLAFVLPIAARYCSAGASKR